MTNRIITRRFGDIEYRDEEVVQFPTGIPGFEKLRRFLLIDNSQYEPFKVLQSIELPPLSFLLLDPMVVKPDFQFSLSDEQQLDLGLKASDPVLVFSVVTLSEKEQSANLFAPLAINPLNRKALQVILHKSGYRVDQPILGN